MVRLVFVKMTLVAGCDRVKSGNEQEGQLGSYLKSRDECRGKWDSKLGCKEISVNCLPSLQNSKSERGS